MPAYPNRLPTMPTETTPAWARTSGPDRVAEYVNAVLTFGQTYRRTGRVPPVLKAAVDRARRRLAPLLKRTS